MATYLFYGPLMLGLIVIYLGARVALGNKDGVWERYAEMMAQRQQPIERTPDWDRRISRIAAGFAVVVGGGLLLLAMVNYVLYF